MGSYRCQVLGHGRPTGLQVCCGTGRLELSEPPLRQVPLTPPAACSRPAKQTGQRRGVRERVPGLEESTLDCGQRAEAAPSGNPPGSGGTGVILNREPRAGEAAGTQAGGWCVGCRSPPAAGLCPKEEPPRPPLPVVKRPSRLCSCPVFTFSLKGLHGHESVRLKLEAFSETPRAAARRAAPLAGLVLHASTPVFLTRRTVQAPRGCCGKLPGNWGHQTILIYFLGTRPGPCWAEVYSGRARSFWRLEGRTCLVVSSTRKPFPLLSRPVAGHLRPPPRPVCFSDPPASPQQGPLGQYLGPNDPGSSPHPKILN